MADKEADTFGERVHSANCRNSEKKKGPPDDLANHFFEVVLSQMPEI
jgi:hypothetical protein